MADEHATDGTDDGADADRSLTRRGLLAANRSGELLEDNERHGHLPGAVDVHWVGNVHGRTLADPAELASLYFDAAGLDQNGRIVVYGQGNVNPTQTWLVLRALGATDVRLYQ